MIKRIKVIFGEKIWKDMIVTIIGQIIILLLVFGLNKLVSMRLGLLGYGEYSIARRTATVLAYVMLFGLGIAIPRYLAIYRQMGNQIKVTRIIISALLMLIFFSLITIGIVVIFRIPFAQVIFGDSVYSALVFPMVFYAFSTALVTFVYSYYRGLDRFYMFSISQIGVQLSCLVLAFLFSDVATLLGTWSIVTGGYGIMVCVKAWIYYYSKADIRFYMRDLRSEIGELTSFCLPRVPGELVLFAYTVTPLIIINHKAGMEISAYFAAAITINTMISPIFSFVGIVLLPLVSRSLVSQRFNEAENKIKTLGKIYLILGIISIAVLEIFASSIVNILFSSEFQPCVPIVRIMAVSVLPYAFYLLLRNPLDAVNKIPYNTINLLISFILLNIFICFSSTATTYAISFVASYALLGLLSIFSWHKCKNEIQQKTSGDSKYE